MTLKSYNKLIEAEKKAKHYFRFGEVDKIIALYLEIVGNMGDYQGMNAEIRKKILAVGGRYEKGKNISKEYIKKLFTELSASLEKNNPIENQKRQEFRVKQIPN